MKRPGVVLAERASKLWTIDRACSRPHTMHPFFHEVRKRPGVYFGDPDLPFTKLMAFIDGCVIGYEMGRQGTAEWPRDFIPQDFDTYVRQHFRCENDTRSWKRRIREQSSSEEDAFRIFFELLDRYEVDHGKTS